MLTIPEMTSKRGAFRLALLLLPALALGIFAWVYLLTGPGTIQSGGFDAGSIALCVIGQTLAIIWALAHATLYVCYELKATLLTRRFFDLSRLRDKLATHKIYLEARGGAQQQDTPISIAPLETQVPALDKAIQDYELIMSSGKTMGRRDVALSVINRVSRAGPLSKLKREQILLLVSELCLACSEHLAIGQRDSESLSTDLREMLREMRHTVHQHTLRNSFGHLLQEDQVQEA